MRLPILIAGLALALAPPALGQETGRAPAAAPAAAEQTPQPELPETGPVEVPRPSETAMRYYRSGMILWGIGVFWGLLIPALILFTGFSARIRNVARRLGGKWSLGTAAQRRRGISLELAASIFAIVYFALSYVLEFPLDYYEAFARQHEYGLSNQAFGQWLGDSLKSFGLRLAFVAVVVPSAYFFLKASPRRWWLYTAVGAVAGIAVIKVVHPFWIAPLFDDFGRMQNTALEAEILDLADRASIDGSRVFEVQKSADTETVNAYVTGFLGTKRIVLWDTIIEKLDRDQLLFVMGHEMGHYVLGHSWKMLLVFGVSLLGALYMAYCLAGGLIHRFRDRFGFDRVTDVASLPLFLLFIDAFALGVMPVTLAFSRHWEQEADRFGLEITQDNRAAATAWLALQRENLSNPNPGVVYRLWRADHPTLAQRIEFANVYRPWESGERLKYGELFRDVRGDTPPR